MSAVDGAPVEPASPDGSPRARIGASALYLAVAVVLFRGALAGGSVPGVPTGEQWGRVFVTGQAARWLSGRAPIGHADLLAAPEGMSFWPVDPLVQVLSAPVALVLGPVAALTAAAIGLCALSGAGPALLARRLGATRFGAVAAGLVAQLAPFLMRNRMDMVLEVDALGVLAVAAVGVLDARRDPTRGALLRAALGVLALAATSPYYAVYLAIGCALWAPFDRAAWRAWAGVALAGAGACALAAAPLAWTESGPSGRLSSAYASVGYSLAPSPAVLPQGASSGGAAPSAAPVARGPSGVRPAGPGGHGARSADQPSGGPPMLVRLAGPWLRWPGGVAVSFAALLGLVWSGRGAAGGLARPGSRRMALLGLAFLLGGPGPMLFARFAAVRSPVPTAPLLALLDAVPLLETLGNPTRMLSAWILLAAVAGGVAARGWVLPSALALLAALEALAVTPDLRVPATPVPASPAVLDALEGPTVVFPSGDPPAWHPAVGPKEALTVAALAGVPVAYDYGRGRVPADVGLQLALATAGAVPIGQTTLRLGSAAWEPGAFRSVLVLEERLSGAQRDAVRAALAERGSLVAEDERGSAWRLGE